MSEYRNYYGPEMYVQELTARGGKTPYGEPMYRLVLAGKVTMKIGAEWQDWDDSTDVQLRGGIVTNEQTGKPEESPYRPLQTRTETREVEKYIAENIDPASWMVERWTPPHIYGTKESWYAPENMVPHTNICMLGPFPSRGQYEMIYGGLKEPPTLSFLFDMIVYWEYQRAKMDTDLERHVRTRIYNATRAEEAAAKKRTEENAARLRDHMSLMMNSSLGAGRWRNAMAEKAGFTSHIGN